MSEAKKTPAKVRFEIKGEIVLEDGLTLDQAIAHVKATEEKANELGVAETKVSVPRLTRVSLGSV